MDPRVNVLPPQAPDWDQPIRYIDRTHAWYDAIGTDNHYRYSHYLEAPFQPLRKPLADSRVVLLTTAAPYQPDKGPQGAGSPYNAAAKFYKPWSGDSARDHDTRIAHVGVNREQMSDDSGCWFPLPALRQAVAQGRIGALAPRLHGVPTNRSQRHTLEVDCPEVLRLCVEDGADVAVLVPNCPVCHQTMSLTARHLEANGIPTVVMGAAKDIVERCGVPRFLFSDFPLGNAAGRPGDAASQAATLELALRILEGAPAARTTVQNPLRWSADPTWKQRVLNPALLSPEDLHRLREDSRRIKATAQQVRDTTLRENQP